MQSESLHPRDKVQIAQGRRAMPDAGSIAALARIFAALGDVTRLRIVAALSQGPLCVGDLAELLGLSLSAVSHQRRLLRATGVIRSERQGRHVLNSLDDGHIITIYRGGLDHVRHGLALPDLGERDE